MKSKLRHTFVARAVTIFAAGMLAADSPSDKDLAEYRTVKTARTREIIPARAGHAGQTGFLGVSALRGKTDELIVETVQPESPAAKAGIRTGDIVTHLDGQPVASPDKLRDDLQTRGPAETVTLTLKRGEERMERQVTLGATSRPRTLGPRGPYLGIVLDASPEAEGVRVDQVAPDSPAAAAGLKPGDQLLKIDSTEVTRALRLADILSEKKPGDNLAVAVRRGREELTLRALLLPEPAGPANGNAAGGNPGAARTGGLGGRPALELWKQPVFHVAIVPIEFPDIKHNPKVSLKYWEQALLGTWSGRDNGGNTADSETGSLNDYFREQSGASFHLEGKVFEWIEVSKKRAEYSPGSGTTNITAVLVEALGKVAAGWQRRLQGLRRSPFSLCGRACALQPRQRLCPARGDHPQLPVEALAVRLRPGRRLTTDFTRGFREGILPHARVARPGRPARESRRRRPGGLVCIVQYVHNRSAPAFERLGQGKARLDQASGHRPHSRTKAGARSDRRFAARLLQDPGPF